MAQDEYSENCINHLVFKRIKPQAHWRKVPSMSSRGGRGRGNGRGGGRNNVTRGTYCKMCSHESDGPKGSYLVMEV